MNRFIASLLVLLAGASFGILSTVVKLGYHAGFSVAEITSSQVLFGCLGLWLLSLPSLKYLRYIRKLTLGQLLLSGLFPGLTGVFYYMALQTISASLGVVLLFQFVWMGLLVDWILQRKAPTLSRWLALVAVLIGTVLAANYQVLLTSHLELKGICLGLLAAASYTGNIVINERVAPEVPPTLRSTLIMTGALIITLVIFPPQFLFTDALSHGLWFWAIILGCFGVIIPPFLFARGVPVVGAGITTILGSIELPVVIIMSTLVLKEHVELIQWAGVVLILLGITLTQQSNLLPRSWSKRLAHNISK
ncbi:multidrug transporter [Ktedonobacter sp. SOSP1-52]|uniref:EamA family transporter n=1 Tax=Ktedonobacter sp. SOSP1-52 TaxID=2778366 RepID=UPI001915F8FE|nr:DMT family transporter [Ktedonobacter sp. SOSP1-52]GHO68660.1 multidrug transporter [Ktedonobacter sp. SOSP1-52]